MNITKFIFSKRTYVILFICIWFGMFFYGVFSGRFQQDITTRNYTRTVYNAITKEITRMGGVYEQFGSLNYSFILEVEFQGYNRDKESNLLNKVIELGFEPRESKENSFKYIFCNNGKGVLVQGYRKLNVEYWDDAYYCK